MIRRPPRSTLSSSSAASDVYKRQVSTQSTGSDLAAAMDFHHKSTQHRWIFQPAALQALREQANTRGYESYVTATGCSPVGGAKPIINTPYSAFGKLNMKSPVPANALETKISPPIHGVSPVLATTPLHEVPVNTNLPERLTVEDELGLQAMFVCTIIRLCTTLLDPDGKVVPEASKVKGAAPVFGFMPLEVMATAVTFFRRYFLNKSLMHQDPRYLCAVCVYMALKVEDIRDFEDISKFLKALRRLDPRMDIEAGEFYKMELQLLEGLGFHLAVHHPFRVIRGAVENWKTWSTKGVNSDMYMQIERFAKLVVNQLLFDDVPFLHHPVHIALACLRHACLRFKVADDFNAWLSERCAASHVLQEMSAKMATIDTKFLGNVKTTLEERLQMLDKKKLEGLQKKYKPFQKGMKKREKSKKRTAEKPPICGSGKKIKVDESPMLPNGNAAQHVPMDIAPGEL
eukprot:TRINITY_DN10788_c0_g1_i1.p1 TRINITY_DN10788_c0_g1~~TRINITY_DN10788_c0_g1_i1.p1  ORF type:complete len:459 (-),score=131.51 TRINITY_DN10788_c0_g1_i1:385-1761(-)